MIRSVKRVLLALAALGAIMLPDRIAQANPDLEQPNSRLKYTGSLTHPTQVAEFKKDEYGLLHPVAVQTRLDDWEDYPDGFE